MANVPLNQLPLTDVELVQIVTLETQPRTISFDTSDEVTTEEVVDEGEDRPLKIKNKILANVAAEDATLGYDLTFKDNVFCPEILQIMQGGTVTYDTDGTTFKSYEPPAIGTNAQKVKFNVVTYSAITDTAGKTGKYAKITWNNGRGNSSPINLKDGEYFSNSYKVNCRPAPGQAPYKIEVVTALPSA